MSTFEFDRWYSKFSSIVSLMLLIVNGIFVFKNFMSSVLLIPLQLSFSLTLDLQSFQEICCYSSQTLCYIKFSQIFCYFKQICFTFIFLEVYSWNIFNLISWLILFSRGFFIWQRSKAFWLFLFVEEFIINFSIN